MGRYDGLLICSDFDNTLCPNVHGQKHVVPQNNVEAIRRFQELGGRFTLVSGRLPEDSATRLGEIRVNAYLAGCNGAIICYPYHSPIYESFVTDDIKELFMRFAHEVIDQINYVMIFGAAHDTRKYIGNDIEELKEFISVPTYKIVSGVKEGNENTVKSIADQICGVAASVTRSSLSRLEIQNSFDNKGAAARRIAEAVGADKLICVGDYENDISMMREADLGYAVENACDSLKTVANRVTVSVFDGALAAIIDEL